MLPARMVSGEVRWFERCAHGIDVYRYCAICADLTAKAEQMFEPVEDNQEGKDGTHVPDPR